LIPPESRTVEPILLVPAAANLVLTSEMPKMSKRKLREQYQQNLIREILAQLDPSTAMLGPTQRFKIFCAQFEKRFGSDPVAKTFLPSKRTFERFLHSEKC
jgi:hypothetical protein